MGGAVSSGESNDDLIDNLCEADYIKTHKVERVFRAVDRGLYYTEPHKTSAYKDIAWKEGNLHLSAPCIYSEVLENLALGPGMSFLNMGSGTGYLSTMCGLIIGKGGVNHGIELYSEVVDYAREKLEEFVRESPAIDLFDLCVPEFVVGNCLDPITSQFRYDRIYCGAACPEESLRSVTDLLKIGGICIVPVNDSLIQITRMTDNTDERKSLLPVSFASLISPRTGTGTIAKEPIKLPDWKLPNLKELCRFEIRSIMRSIIQTSDVQPAVKSLKRRRRRQERRRASRLLVVQRRRAEDGETGFVAVAYSMGNNSSDEDEGRERSGRESADEMLYDERNNGESSDDDNNDNDTNEHEHEPMDATTAEQETSSTSNNADSGAFSQSESSSQNQNQNGSSSSSSGSASASMASATRSNRSLIHRARQARAQFSNGTDGLLGRLRDIYRRREQQSNRSDLFRHDQDVASRAATRIRQFVSTYAVTAAESALLQNPTPINENETNGQNANDEGDNARASSSSTEAQPEESNSTAPQRTKRAKGCGGSCGDDKNEDSCVWSESEESTTTTISTSEEEAQPKAHRTSTESGVVTDSDKIDDKKTLEEQEQEKGKKKGKNSVSMQMKSRIRDLPLPPPVKLYLNYYRELEPEPTTLVD